MVSITKAQQQALLRKWRDHDNGMTYRQFRRSVEPMIGGDGAVRLPGAPPAGRPAGGPQAGTTFLGSRTEELKHVQRP